MHALLRHILLRQDDGQFLRTVVAVVEENNGVAFLDCPINRRIVYRFDKFIRYTFVIRFLHSLHHVGSLLAFSFDEQIVGFLDAFPTLVAVHCIETADDGCDGTARLLAVCRQLFDETLTALRICVAAIHEAVDEGLLDAIFLRDVAEFEQMVERRMHTTV